MTSSAKLRLIKSALISEKSAALSSASNQYVFNVKPQATKQDVISAIEAGFGVKVERVNVLNVKGKNKRFGKSLGRRSDWKKAYVKLKAGFTLDLVGG